MEFKLLPAAPGLAKSAQANTRQISRTIGGSLYYQYKFHAAHGRWPTWVDAMAHCSEEIKEFWVEELDKEGVRVG